MVLLLPLLLPLLLLPVEMWLLELVTRKVISKLLNWRPCKYKVYIVYIFSFTFETCDG